MPNPLRLNYPTNNTEGPLRSQYDVDKEAIASQKNDPLWKRMGAGAIDALANIPKGILGMDPASDESNSGYIANALTQLGGAGNDLLKAGLPFAAISKGNSVFHGTGRAIEEFNPRFYGNDKGMLSKMTHFAENPKYADNYAIGLGGTDGLGRRKGINSNIIPAKIDAKNVLDLINPTTDDMSQMVASMPSEIRRPIIDSYKSGNKLGSTRTRQNLQQDILNALENPSTHDTMPFDAIRYSARGEPSYAVPERTNIHTPWGTPLHKAPNPDWKDYPKEGAIQLPASPTGILHDQYPIDRRAPSKLDPLSQLLDARENPIERRKSLLQNWYSQLDNLNVK